jgi:hypothetical protein
VLRKAQLRIAHGVAAGAGTPNRHARCRDPEFFCKIAAIQRRGNRFVRNYVVSLWTRLGA